MMKKMTQKKWLQSSNKLNPKFKKSNKLRKLFLPKVSLYPNPSSLLLKNQIKKMMTIWMT